MQCGYCFCLSADSSAVFEFNLAEHRHLDVAVKGVAVDCDNEGDILAGEHARFDRCGDCVVILLDFLNGDIGNFYVGNVEIEAVFAVIVENFEINVARKKHCVDAARPFA